MKEGSGRVRTLHLPRVFGKNRDRPGKRRIVGIEHDQSLDDGAHRDPARTAAMICGPGPMVTAVSDTVPDLWMPMERVIYERFDYSGGRSRQDRRQMRQFLALSAAPGLGVAAFTVLA